MKQKKASGTIFAATLITNLLILSIAAPALAQEPATDASQREIRREATLQDREERQETRRVEAENRIRAHIGAMLRRFNAAIDWLEKISERIESRIAKLKEDGVNTSEAEGYLNEAKTEIAEAKSAVSSLSEAAEEALSAESLREAFQRVRELVQTARESIKDAHAALIKAVRSLKPGINRGGETETP
jgi:chromosome segregation ATPase